MAGECGPPAGVGARVRMIRMPALPNTAPAGCDFDAELLADAGARRGGQPHVASAVSRAVSAGQRELVERHGVDLDNGLAGLHTVVDEIVVRRCPSSRPAAHRDTERLRRRSSHG